MSYIIAFVSYPMSENAFPVDCLRTDLKAGENVVVRRPDGTLRVATIQRIEYLNWDCKGRIECKASDITRDETGNIQLPRELRRVYGMTTSEIFVRELLSLGWISVKPNRKMYRVVLCKSNKSDLAYIYVRRNGIDLQILQGEHQKKIIPERGHPESLDVGRVVRHALSHTTFNLFEGIVRFSKSFSNNEVDLDRFFVRQGSSDKRNEKLLREAEKRKAEIRSRGSLWTAQDEYDAVGDCPEDTCFGFILR